MTKTVRKNPKNQKKIFWPSARSRAEKDCAIDPRPKNFFGGVEKKSAVKKNQRWKKKSAVKKNQRWKKSAVGKKVSGDKNIFTFGDSRRGSRARDFFFWNYLKLHVDIAISERFAQFAVKVDQMVIFRFWKTWFFFSLWKNYHYYYLFFLSGKVDEKLNLKCAPKKQKKWSFFCSLFVGPFWDRRIIVRPPRLIC